MTFIGRFDYPQEVVLTPNNRILKGCKLANFFHIIIFNFRNSLLNHFDRMILMPAYK